MTNSTNANITATRESMLTAAVQGYRTRRSARARLSQIERELSSYRTPAEIQELDFMMERAGDDIDPAYVQVIDRLRMRAA